MILNQGDKLLVVNRRLYREDDPRFFTGVVQEFDEGVAKVTGYSFVRDMLRGSIERKTDKRTKLFSITSGTLLVYLMPADVDIESLHFVAAESTLHLADGGDFEMNLSEWTHR